MSPLILPPLPHHLRRSRPTSVLRRQLRCHALAHWSVIGGLALGAAAAALALGGLLGLVVGWRGGWVGL